LEEIEERLSAPCRDDRFEELQKEVGKVRIALNEIIKGLKENNMFS
jgi:hypothetical protein